MSRGYVVLAQNTDQTDYLKCAEALAMSLLWVMPEAKISLITDQKHSTPVFDKIILLPHGDQATGSWKLANDWQVYDASPYDETIKLEADMFIPRNIDYWWDVLADRELAVCSTIRNFKQEISDARAYRSFIYDNKLPDTYNAITYFKKSQLTSDFFSIVRDVFENWPDYKSIMRCEQNEIATTDWAYAIAAQIVGQDRVLIPGFTAFSMVHMKRFINHLYTDDWTDSLVYELLPDAFRINTFPQMYPVHYHVKSFADKILESTY